MKRKPIAIYVFIIISLLLVVFLAYKNNILFSFFSFYEYFEHHDKEYKIAFTTFGTKDSFTKSLKRIEKEAFDIDIFDDIKTFNEEDLKSNAEFWNANGKFIESNKRGYGYWIWKPYLILNMLKKMNDGDVLVYCDCGSTIKTSGRKRMLEYINDCVKSKTGVYCFYLNYVEKQWTKMDLFSKMDMNTTEWLDSNQIMATDLLVKKCPESIALLEKWYELCMEDNYHYLTDITSKLPNDKTFSEHRHDQSIFSLLVKKTGGCFIQQLLDEQPEPEHAHPDRPIFNSRIRDGEKLH